MVFLEKGRLSVRCDSDGSLGAVVAALILWTGGGGDAGDGF